MTIEQWLYKMCMNKGLSIKQSDMIITAIKTSPQCIAMKTRWSDFVEGYPVQLLAVLLGIIDRTVRDANL